MRTIEAIHDIQAPPAQVWAVLMDFPSHAEWNPLFARIQGKAAVGESLEVVVRDAKGGNGMTLTPTVLQVNEGICFAWRGSLRIPKAFEGTHEFILEPLGQSSTRFIHKERFRGFLLPFLGRVLKETEQGFHAMNQALATEVLARNAQSE